MLPQTSRRNVGWISQSHRSQQTSLSVMGLSLSAFWAASGSKDKPDLAQSQWKVSSKHWHVWIAVPEPWRSPWTNGHSALRTAHSTHEFLNKSSSHRSLQPTYKNCMAEFGTNGTKTHHKNTAVLSPLQDFFFIFGLKKIYKTCT